MAQGLFRLSGLRLQKDIGPGRRRGNHDQSNGCTHVGFLDFEGLDLTDGPHKIELKKKGTGPLYYNAYLTNFTLEDFITKAGLEVKVERKYYKLIRDDDDGKVARVLGFFGPIPDHD